MDDGENAPAENNGLRTLLLALILLPVHLVGSAWLSDELFQLAGGIQHHGKWSHFGGISYAWTNVAWLPGGLALSVGGVFGAIGLWLLVLGSGVAACSAAVTFFKIASRFEPQFGWRACHLWLPLVLWFGWIPVPAAMTLTYLWTVAY